MRSVPTSQDVLALYDSNFNCVTVSQFNIKISISCCSPSWFCCYAMCAPLLSSLKSISFAKTRKIFRKGAFLPLSFSTFWKAHLMDLEGGGRSDGCQIHVLSWKYMSLYMVGRVGRMEEEAKSRQIHLLSYTNSPNLAIACLPAHWVKRILLRKYKKRMFFQCKTEIWVTGLVVV